MASTVFCVACLAIWLRVILFAVWSDVGPRGGTPALESSCTVPPQKSVELLSVRVGCSEFTSLHWTPTGCNGTNGREQPSFHSNRSTKVEINEDTPGKGLNVSSFSPKNDLLAPCPAQEYGIPQGATFFPPTRAVSLCIPGTAGPRREERPKPQPLLPALSAGLL